LARKSSDDVEPKVKFEEVFYRLINFEMASLDSAEGFLRQSWGFIYTIEGWGGSEGQFKGGRRLM
jgi:hypothetical protein